MQIHQLNDFVGALGSGVFLPLDNGQDTGKMELSRLFAGNTYTTLASGRISALGETLNLSDSVQNHEFIDIYYAATTSAYDADGVTEFRTMRIPKASLPKRVILRIPTTGSISSRWIYVQELVLDVQNTTVTVDGCKLWYWTGVDGVSAQITEGGATDIFVYRIDGIDTPLNDAGIVKIATVTLPSANWSNSTQTISVADVTDSSSVLISPAPSSLTPSMAAGVYCSGQSDGRLTFTCGDTPSVDLTMNIMFVG